MASRLSAFFTRRVGSQSDLRGEIWRAGELAVCVRDDWAPVPVYGDHVKVGDVLRVTAVTDEAPFGERAFWLWFGDPNAGYRADCFRKPVADREPASAKFSALIKRPSRAPAPVPEPAL